MSKISTRDHAAISIKIRNRDEFKTHGALAGRAPYGQAFGPWDDGRLPRGHQASFLTADYAVYSYATPIAWHVPEFGWVMPETRYSPTTGRHQSAVRSALRMAMVRPVAA